MICHVGPTNSGKTHSALKAMTESGSGIYCGPLRLLAWEVADKLAQQGIQCNLITGQEREVHEEARFTSCTVEMLDTGVPYESAVVDEFQLVGDFHRGWAWTRAILGIQVLTDIAVGASSEKNNDTLQAKEIHLCGSPTMLGIVKKICAITGNEMSVLEYERLSPLVIGENALCSYKNVRKGDCVIGFSRAILYDIKAKIEKVNRNIKCCIIYGNLPPTTRKEQAKLFNSDSSGYDVLVASDAVGMGLNLSIRRVILSTLTKFDGNSRRQLFSSEIKQIGGRAGRFSSLFENGEVITYHERDMQRLRSAITSKDALIKSAGLSPSKEQLEIFGIMVDLAVTQSELTGFWGNYLGEYWGSESLRTDAMESVLTVGRSLFPFESLTFS